MRTALTIAGSDSGGGAGLQADLKTFAALGVYGTSAVTAVTAQNTLGVTAVLAMPPDLVEAQIEAVLSDLGADAIKIGMLANAAVARVVAAVLRRHAGIPVVLDTVMVAKGGSRLLEPDAVAALRQDVMPLAAVVTPNVPEAEALTGLTLSSVADLHRAAAALIALGAPAAIVKGGHLDGPAIDVLATREATIELRAPRVDSRHTHGTGCTFSAALAAELARGANLVAAAQAAKAYVTRAIQAAPGLGHGHGPLGHL